MTGDNQTSLAKPDLISTVAGDNTIRLGWVLHSKALFILIPVHIQILLAIVKALITSKSKMGPKIRFLPIMSKVGTWQ